MEALAIDEHGDKELVLMGIWEGSPEDRGGGTGFVIQVPGSSSPSTTIPEIQTEDSNLCH